MCYQIASKGLCTYSRVQQKEVHRPLRHVHFNHMCCVQVLIMSLTQDTLCEIRRAQKMDLKGASQTTGSTSSDKEQTVRYMKRLSQELHLDILQPFIHKIWNHNAFWEDANCENWPGG